MYINIYISLLLFNIAMENGPFIDDFPITTSIYKGFSMAMLNNQMVFLGISLISPDPFDPLRSQTRRRHRSRCLDRCASLGLRPWDSDDRATDCSNGPMV